MDKQWRAAAFQAGYIDEADTLWFSSISVNGLYKWEKDAPHACYMASFPNCPAGAERIHKFCIPFGEYLYFVESGKMAGIHRYSKVSGEMVYIGEGLLLGEDGRSEFLPVEYVKRDKLLIFIPYQLSMGLCLYDMEMDCFLRQTEFFRDVIKGNAIESGKVLRATCDGEYMWFPVYRTNVVLRLKLDDFTIEATTLPEGSSLLGLCATKSGFWVTLADSYDLLFWNVADESIRRVPADTFFSVRDPRIGELTYTKTIALGKKIFLLAESYDDIVVIDGEDIHSLETVAEKRQIYLEDNSAYKRFGYQVKDNRLYIFPTADLCLLEINSETNEVSCRQIKMIPEEIYTDWNGLFPQQLTREYGNDLQELELFVRLMPEGQKIKPEENINCGKLIHETVKRR